MRFNPLLPQNPFSFSLAKHLVFSRSVHSQGWREIISTCSSQQEGLYSMHFHCALKKVKWHSTECTNHPKDRPVCPEGLFPQSQGSSGAKEGPCSFLKILSAGSRAQLQGGRTTRKAAQSLLSTPKLFGSHLQVAAASRCSTALDKLQGLKSPPRGPP